MARFTRLKVLNTIVETGMARVFYHADIDVARQVAGGCAAGGCPLLEFTNRGGHAWEVFTELERYCAREVPELILGVGSVVWQQSDNVPFEQSRNVLLTALKLWGCKKDNYS